LLDPGGKRDALLATKAAMVLLPASTHYKPMSRLPNAAAPALLAAPRF
jgi:hypothetical protein